MCESGNESVRAVLLTPSGSVLLMKVAGSRGELWITPGGRRNPGEKPRAALERELHEETGQIGLHPEAEIWRRHGTFLCDGRRQHEFERFFLVRTLPFHPVPADLDEAERRRFRGHQWWTIEEISGSAEAFVPAHLGRLLAELQLKGPLTARST